MKTSQKAPKTALALCTGANNISARRFGSGIRLLKCLQAGCKITLTPSRYRVQSKKEMSHARTCEYLQEYFQPKISRKIRIFASGPEKQ